MTNPKAEQRVSNDAHVVFIENDRLRLGVDLSLGGAVTHLAEHGHPNLINSFDWGASGADVLLQRSESV